MDEAEDWRGPELLLFEDGTAAALMPPDITAGAEAAEAAVAEIAVVGPNEEEAQLHLVWNVVCGLAERAELIATLKDFGSGDATAAAAAAVAEPPSGELLRWSLLSPPLSN